MHGASKVYCHYFHDLRTMSVAIHVLSSPLQHVPPLTECCGGCEAGVGGEQGGLGREEAGHLSGRAEGEWVREYADHCVDWLLMDY